jgi:glutathione S-transferase
LSKIDYSRVSVTDEFMLTLYFWPGSSSVVPHIVLEEIGTAYERQYVNFTVGEHKSASYLKINPHGKVPALAVDGVVLTENVAILSYLARRFPQARLLPESTLDEARCISIMAWFASMVHPTFARIIRPQRVVNDAAAHASLKDMAWDLFWDQCREINQLLDGKEWMMGAQYTVCDPYAFFIYDQGVRIKRPMHELSAYSAFSQRMLERPAVRKVRELEESFLKGANPWDGPYYGQPRLA